MDKTAQAFNVMIRVSSQWAAIANMRVEAETLKDAIEQAMTFTPFEWHCVDNRFSDYATFGNSDGRLAMIVILDHADKIKWEA